MRLLRSHQSHRQPVPKLAMARRGRVCRYDSPVRRMELQRRTVQRGNQRPEPLHPLDGECATEQRRRTSLLWPGPREEGVGWTESYRADPTACPRWNIVYCKISLISSFPMKYSVSTNILKCIAAIFTDGAPDPGVGCTNNTGPGDLPYDISFVAGTGSDLNVQSSSSSSSSPTTTSSSASGTGSSAPTTSSSSGSQSASGTGTGTGSGSGSSKSSSGTATGTSSASQTTNTGQTNSSSASGTGTSSPVPFKGTAGKNELGSLLSLGLAGISLVAFMGLGL
jgi:hypothetical protein